MKLDAGALSLSERRAGLTDGFFFYLALWAAAAIAGPLLRDGWDEGYNGGVTKGCRGDVAARDQST